MKAKELKLKTIDELKKIVAETRENTLSLNLQRADRKLKKVAQFKKNRQLVSRILTIIGEKEKNPSLK
jgi:ribosomal protein L29